MSGDVITELFAFVALDDSDGNEGVMAFWKLGSWIPMIGADMARIESLIPLADKIAKETGVEYQIRHFSFTGNIKR